MNLTQTQTSVSDRGTTVVLFSATSFLQGQQLQSSFQTFQAARCLQATGAAGAAGAAYSPRPRSQSTFHWLSLEHGRMPIG